MLYAKTRCYEELTNLTVITEIVKKSEEQKKKTKKKNIISMCESLYVSLTALLSLNDDRSTKF